MKKSLFIIIGLGILLALGLFFVLQNTRQSTIIINEGGKNYNILKLENQFTPSNWTIEGDTVYINDSKVFISATPHTAIGWVNFVVQPKTYTGNVDLALGFDTNIIKPTKAENNPHLENVSHSYTCPSGYYLNYTMSPKYFWCWNNYTTGNNGVPNITTQHYDLIYEHSFISANLSLRTAYWTEEETVWNDISGAFDRLDLQFQNMTRWYFRKNIPVIAGQTYTFRVFIQPERMDFEKSKYWFAIKPSSETFLEAIENDHLYALDPWTAGLNTGLLGYWAFDDGSGTVIRDNLSLAHNGTGVNLNGLAWKSGASCKIGGCLDLLASNDYAFFGTSISDGYDAWNNYGNNFTHSFWMKFPTTGAGGDPGFIGKFNQPATTPYSIAGATANIYVRINGTATGFGSSGSNIADFQWSLMTFTYNGTFTIFINGVHNFTYSGTQVINPSDSPVVLGFYNSLGGQDGNFSIDEMGYWNRTLSQSEITALYNSGAGITYSSVFAPTVNMTYPLNQVYATSVSQLNYTISGIAGDYCWYSKDNGSTNSSSVVAGINFSASSDPETNTWTVFCNSSTNDMGQDKETFYVNQSVGTTLQSPANSANFSIPYVEFIYNSTVFNTNLTNTTISVWFANSTLFYSNYTVLSGSVLQTLTRNISIGEGSYIWGANTCGDSVPCNIATNRTFRIDLTPPVINITNPLNSSSILTYASPYAVFLNTTAYDETALDKCWYYNGTANVSITCGNNATINLAEGSHTLYFYVNDTSGNFNFAYTTFLINLISSNVTYQTQLIEGNPNKIYLNLTATSISSIAANLSWNGTNYIMIPISNNGTYAILYNQSIAPYVDTTTGFNFSISYIINGLSNITTTYNQTVFDVPVLNITNLNCSKAAYNFSLFDEANFTALKGTFEYNFYYGTPANSSISRSYGQIVDANFFYVCINDTISNNWTLGSGEIFYRAEGYTDRRYYLFSGATFNNVTNNITLYDLSSADQTSFKLEVEDTSLNPYVNKYTALIRYYPDLNRYSVVDMGLTDETGSTVIHVKTEDVDYRIGVYELDGSLIKLANPIRMVCLISPCTYTLRISPTETDYTNFLNVDYTFDFNETTGIWTFVFSDASQATQSINLTIYKMTGTSVYSICTNTVIGYSGAVTCNTSGYTGTLKGMVERSSSPQVPIAQKIITIGKNAFTSTFGLWISLLLGLPIIFIFAFMTPLGAVLGGIIALIPAFYFGAINIQILGGIAVLGGIVMHFLKRIS